MLCHERRDPRPNSHATSPRARPAHGLCVFVAIEQRHELPQRSLLSLLNHAILFQSGREVGRPRVQAGGLAPRVGIIRVRGVRRQVIVRDERLPCVSQRGEGCRTSAMRSGSPPSSPTTGNVSTMLAGCHAEIIRRGVLLFDPTLELLVIARDPRSTVIHIHAFHSPPLHLIAL